MIICSPSMIQESNSWENDSKLSETQIQEESFFQFAEEQPDILDNVETSVTKIEVNTLALSSNEIDLLIEQKIEKNEGLW